MPNSPARKIMRLVERVGPNGQLITMKNHGQITHSVKCRICRTGEGKPGAETRVRFDDPDAIAKWSLHNLLNHLDS